MDNLDPKELLHLALHASSHDRHDDAINYLKQALKVDNNNAFVNFLLAAEYAQIAFYDRALEYFDKTTTLAPELYVARLQYGLLLTSLNIVDEAKSVLLSLEDLEEGDCYRLFAEGLRAFIDEDLSKAKDFFNEGIAANLENLPLNEDFKRIVQEIEQKVNSGNNANNDVIENSSANSFLLSSYKH
jgi:tetratricopeptide (TPR) repeat protein